MDTRQPLAGIRVVDFTWVFAGPLGTRILANFGAEVIKVESRVHIDSLRNEVRPPGSLSENVSATFNQANTGKLSLTIDLGKEAGRDLVRRLIARADVVTNNYRPGVMERMGLGYESLRAISPGIVLLNLPGCGRTGPWANIATMGNLIMGASGLNWLTGFPGTPPDGLGTAYPDFVVPYLTVTTVLAALSERRRTGVGQEINLAQLPAAISLLGVEWLQFATSGEAPRRRANRDPNYCPHGVYPTAGDDRSCEARPIRPRGNPVSTHPEPGRWGPTHREDQPRERSALGDDRWCAIAVCGDDEWRRLSSLLGQPALADDPRFATHALRKQHEDELDRILGDWTRTIDRWALAALLQTNGIAAAAVEDLRDTMETDPQLRAHFQRVEPQPSDPDVEITVDGEAIRFAGVERPLRRAPMLGEHSEAILRDLAGVSEEEFNRLVLDGVIN